MSSFINPIVGSTYPRPTMEAAKADNSSGLGSGFSYAMGQASAGAVVLTPTVAQSLMHRSMSTGVPTAELEQYGGYSAVKAMFDANGGKYSLNSINSQQRQQLAQEVANTGVGNIELLVNEQVALSPGALSAMLQNGIPQNTIKTLQEKTKEGLPPQTQSYTNTAGVVANDGEVSTLTASQVQDLMHRSMTTGVPTSEMEKYGGYNVIKTMYDKGEGSYSLSAIPAPQHKEMALQVANTGVGNMAAPVTEKIGISAAVLQTMDSNGIDKATIDELSQATRDFNLSNFVDSNSYISTLMKELESKE